MIVDFVGKSPGVPEEAVQEAITFYTHDALDTMAALCKKWKAASSTAKQFRILRYESARR